MFPFLFAPQPEGGRQEKRRKRRSSSSSPSRRRRRHKREERGRSRRRARSSTSPSERKGKKRSRESPVKDLPPARAGYAWAQVPLRAASRLPLYCKLRRHRSSRRDGSSKTGSQRPRGGDSSRPLLGRGSSPLLHGRGMDSRHGIREPGTKLGVLVNGSTSSRNGTRVGTSGTTLMPAKKATRGPGRRPHPMQRGSLRPPTASSRRKARQVQHQGGDARRRGCTSPKECCARRRKLPQAALGPGHPNCSARPKPAAQRP